MSVTVYIPVVFRRLTADQATLKVEGNSILEVLNNLDKQFPGLKAMICDQQGNISNHMNVYVNKSEIASLQGTKTALKDGDEITLLPAIAGGAMAVSFTEDQIRRYSRHIILRQVGGRGQRKLLNSRVLLVGAGGLGSPAGLYLAAAGVGTLGIVDGDSVELSNLQRQLLHHTHDLARPKVDSAAEAIAELNPDVNVIRHNTVLSSENAIDILKDYDVIVNGCDNFPTRYLVNDSCVFLQKPLVDAAVLRFEAQTTVFLPGQGCYRCLFPAPPPPGMVPSCQEAGVLGVLPGIIGCIQAMETIKLILGIGKGLAGRLILVDALAMEFRDIRLRRDPDCPVCGDNPTIKELVDYEEFCGVPGRDH